MLSIKNVTYTKCYLYKMLPIPNVTIQKCTRQNVLDKMLLYENVLYETLLIPLNMNAKWLLYSTLVKCM